MLYASHYDSPIGRILLTGSETALTCVCFQDHRIIPDLCEIWDDLQLFHIVRDWLSRYFRGENPDPKQLPARISGTAFQQEVWKIISQIPYGETVTYGQIATLLAEQGSGHMSAQAVGGAVGRNPMHVVIPCHRVISAGGSLTGYAGGLWRKEYLLKLEQGVK